MDALVSHHYQDHSRPGSSSSNASLTMDQMVYHSPSQTSLGFQPHYPPQRQSSQRRPSPTSSLQISTTAVSQEQDADEQTAHPSRMQPQFPLPQAQPQQSAPTTESAPVKQAPSSAVTFTRPLTHREQELLAHLDRLKFFLATAPSRWNAGEHEEADSSSIPVGHPSSSHPALNRFLLPNQEYVSCVLWSGLYHITGTDIVRALVFRFEAFGRPVRNMKKFEEGVFSDLRNLKPGTDACLEEPKSPFLDLLFKYQCIRTQKKQKVFYWFSVPHDRLFLDALERDLKREKMGLEPTTTISGEPALSFTYDPKRSLYEQFCKAQGGYEGEGELEAAVRRADELAADDGSSDNASSADEGVGQKSLSAVHSNPTFHSMFSLFEGSPTYKQRRKKTAKNKASMDVDRANSMDEYGSTQIRDTTRMSAADMFMAQARGSRPGPSQDYPQRGRLESRNTFPVPHSQYGHSGIAPQFFRNQSATLPGEWPYMDTSSPEVSAPTPADAPRTKVFVCPLFSCGRMYKRMEHLKRHVRSHTMERPFQCHRCNKKFSRQDNLSQHLRIHMRMDAEGVTGTTTSYMAAMGEDESAHADVEDLDELEGVDTGLLNIGVCEVEVEGAVHEVEGGEEGLITTNPSGYAAEPNGLHPMVGQDTYYPGSAADQQFPMSSSPEPTPFSELSGGVNWMPRTAPSPAFSTQSMPSPHQRVLHMSQPGSYNQMGEYMTSMSAPSHKATFDHNAIYPAQVLPSTGPGPIRRHRSVTPSLARYGESIRRPYSAAMTDQPAHGNRSYHPYAVSSHSSSAQSSPGTYSVPLDYNTSMTGSLPSHLSRSSSSSRPGSSHLPEQLNQMLNLDSMDAGYTGESSTTTGGSFGGMYRSDSPASYTSGTYSHDGSSADGHQMYPVQSQYAGNVDGYYPSHPQSVPL